MFSNGVICFTVDFADFTAFTTSQILVAPYASAAAPTAKNGFLVYFIVRPATAPDAPAEATKNPRALPHCPLIACPKPGQAVEARPTPHFAYRLPSVS